MGDDVRPPWNHASSILTKRLIECLSPVVEVSLATTKPGEPNGSFTNQCETLLVGSTGIRAVDAFRLAMAAERSSADVFHVVGTNALVFSPACKFFGARGQIVRHIFTAYEPNERLTGPVRRAVNAGFISAYCFTTPWMGRWKDELAATTRRFVLRPPVNCDLYRPLREPCKRLLESDGHDYSLLYMGPLWRTRFPSQSVLRALRELLAEGLDLHLTVLASASRTTTSQAEEIWTIGKGLGVERHLSLRRLDVSEQERVQAYNEADLVIFPYVGPEPEQLADPPFGILESMACGSAVLATRVLSIPEVIADGENGFLVTTPTTENIRVGIRRALSHPVIDELAESARDSIVRRFGYPVIRGEAVIAYKTLSQ